MKTLITIIALHITITLHGQSDVQDVTMENTGDLLMIDDESASDTNYEALVQFLSHPINLNSADADELTLLTFLSQQQIKNIIHHREANGNFLNVFELQ